MKIIALMDNLEAIHKGLINQHGLSMYIEGEEHTLLFDFGESANTFKNFKSLNLNPDSLDLGIISHGHYDHANGFLSFMDYFKGKKLITGLGFFDKKYACENGILNYLGLNFNKLELETRNIEHVEFENIYKIDDEFYLMGNFKSEKPNPYFKVEKGETLVTDDFSDEIALIIRGKLGLSVVLGCSHPGVISILREIKEKFKEDIINVFGGTHLVASSEAEILRVLEDLKALKVENVYFSHCSGSRALEIFSKDKNIKSAPLKTGAEIRL